MLSNSVEVKEVKHKHFRSIATVRPVQQVSTVHSLNLYYKSSTFSNFTFHRVCISYHRVLGSPAFSFNSHQLISDHVEDTSVYPIKTQLQNSSTNQRSPLIRKPYIRNPCTYDHVLVIWFFWLIWWYVFEMQTSLSFEHVYHITCCRFCFSGGPFNLPFCFELVTFEGRLGAFLL